MNDVQEKVKLQGQKIDQQSPVAGRLGLMELLCILTDVVVTGLNAFVRTWRIIQKWVSFKLCNLHLNKIFFFPWRRKWQLISVFFPGKSHGQRSLAGYSLWGHKRVGHDLATKQQQQRMFFKSHWPSWGQIGVSPCYLLQGFCEEWWHQSSRLWSHCRS